MIFSLGVVYKSVYPMATEDNSFNQTGYSSLHSTLSETTDYLLGTFMSIVGKYQNYKIELFLELVWTLVCRCVRLVEVVACSTTGQQVERSILLQLQDSLQNSSQVFPGPV